MLAGSSVARWSPALGVDHADCAHCSRGPCDLAIRAETVPEGPRAHSLRSRTRPVWRRLPGPPVEDRGRLRRIWPVRVSVAGASRSFDSSRPSTPTSPLPCGPRRPDSSVPLCCCSPMRFCCQGSPRSLSPPTAAMALILAVLVGAWLVVPGGRQSRHGARMAAHHRRHVAALFLWWLVSDFHLRRPRRRSVGVASSVW